MLSFFRGFVRRRMSGEKRNGPHHPTIRFTADIDRYSDYDIGKWTYGEPTILSWGEGATFRIGRYCSIARDVTIVLGGEHRHDWVTTYPFTEVFKQAKHIQGHPRTKGDVVIENDVWIGHEAMILSGVTIGNGAVVGARSLVSKDVPPYAIVAGNPAALKKFRFELEEIDALLKIRWWDWPEEQIVNALPDLLSTDISRFINRYANPR